MSSSAGPAAPAATRARTENWVAPENTKSDVASVSSGPISGRAAAPNSTPNTAMAIAAGAAVARRATYAGRCIGHGLTVADLGRGHDYTAASAHHGIA